MTVVKEKGKIPRGSRLIFPKTTVRPLRHPFSLRPRDVERTEGFFVPGTYNHRWVCAPEGVPYKPTGERFIRYLYWGPDPCLLDPGRKDTDSRSLQCVQGWRFGVLKENSDQGPRGRSGGKTGTGGVTIDDLC